MTTFDDSEMNSDLNPLCSIMLDSEYPLTNASPIAPSHWQGTGEQSQQQSTFENGSTIYGEISIIFKLSHILH
jgi:hypothetical protein